MCWSKVNEDCPVCFTDKSVTCNLVCGHSFCHSCIKEWYSKGEAGRSCPMCRKPLYFKGMYKKQLEWNNEYLQNELSRVFANSFDDILDEATFDYLITHSKHPRWGAFILMIQLQEMEKKFMKLKDWYDPDELQDELDDEDEESGQAVLIVRIMLYDFSLNVPDKYTFKNINARRIKWR